jgi:hypothetical protein
MSDYSSLIQLPIELRNAIDEETSGGVERGSDVHTDVAGEINTVTEKTSPVGADVLILEDSAAGFVKKKSTLANLPKTTILDGDINVENGFENTTDSIMSFAEVSRTFTITPAVSTFKFWSGGLKFTKSAGENIVIGPVEGIHWIYYDNTGTLQETK